MKKSKIIISGGDGFIGRTIILQYHKEFDFVILKRKESQIHFPEIQKLAKIMIEPEKGNQLISEFFGAHAMVLLGDSRPGTLFQVIKKDVFDLDLYHSKKMLDLCVFNNIQRVVFASSKSVYGLNDSQPFSEDIEPLSETLYGLNKLLTEKLGLYYQNNHGISFTGLRLAQVFGMGDKYPNMLNIFMRNAKENKDIELWGNGKSDFRSYVYVKDVASVFIHFIKNRFPGIFNVSLEKSFCTLDIARIISGLTQTKTKLVFNTDKISQDRKENLSTTKITEFANWKCSWEMDEAILDFWNETKI